MNNRPVNGAGHVNGSSVQSSRSVTPEPVADLPVHPPQVYEQNEDRPPTPFPAGDTQPMDEVLADIVQLPMFNRPPPPLHQMAEYFECEILSREQPLENPQSMSSSVRPPPPLPQIAQSLQGDTQPMDEVLADIVQLPMFNRPPPPLPQMAEYFECEILSREQPLENPQSMSSSVRPPPPLPQIAQSLQGDTQPMDEVLADIVQLPMLNRPPPPLPQMAQSLQGELIIRPPSPPPLPLCQPCLPPRKQPLENPQPSTDQSSSDVQLNPLTPIVNIHHPFPGLQSSTGAGSVQGTEDFIRSLQEDRQRNESRFRSVTSGLYDFANMMIPGLPEYEPLVFTDGDEDEVDDRSNGRFTRRLGMVVILLGAIYVGKHFGHFLLNLKNH